MVTADAPAGCNLSVVVAVTGSGEGDAGAWTHLTQLRECGHLDTEVILVGALVSKSPPVPAEAPLVMVAADPKLLVPHLWGLGLARARGRAVAFTSDEFRVSPTWARALLAALDAGAAGATGRITLPPESGPVARAIYLLRYARFAGREPAEGQTVPDIPGDNAAYDRATLMRHAEDFADGFWEVTAHRHIHEDGGTLVLVPGASAEFHPTAGWARFAGQRFQHGRHFGRYRVETLGHPRWRCLLAAPLVPFVLAGRALRDAVHAGLPLGPQMRAVPALLWFAAAWAAGEALGAATASG